MKIYKTANYNKIAQFGSPEEIVKSVVKGLDGNISDRNIEWVIEQLDFEHSGQWKWRDVLDFLKNEMTRCEYCSGYKHEEEFGDISNDPKCKECEAEDEDLRLTEEAERGSPEFQDYPESSFNRTDTPDPLRPQF